MEVPMGCHTEDSQFEEGDRVKVVDIYKTYRDKQILGATGKILRLDFDRSNGWSYCVFLDDPEMQQWAATEWKPPKKGEVHYREQWFSEAELGEEVIVKLNDADLEAANVQVRFRLLSRKVGTCILCRRPRLSCSVRLRICQTCFHGEKLRAKRVI